MTKGRGCAAAGCEKKHYGRGLCANHYRRLVRAERDADPEVPRCTVQGCPRAAEVRGRCGAHYSAALRAGEVGAACAVSGCTRSASSRGLCSRHRGRVNAYGLSVAELVRFEGDCDVCGRPAEHVDHNHETGVVRGALCARCNHALGHAQDSPALLRALADYLDTHNSKETTK